MADEYEQADDGEWIRPVMRGHRNACCDCGLVHVIDYRIVDGRVEFRARRHNRSTAAMRRKTKKAKR